MPTDDNHDLAVSRSSRRSIVRTGIKLAYAAPMVTASMKLSHEAVGAASLADCLGRVWDEHEYFDQYHGTWTRVSGSSFTASWTGPTSVTADLQISVVCVQGGAVSVIRTNSSDGNDCTYTGTYDGSSGVSGTYTCIHAAGPFDWHATIS